MTITREEAHYDVIAAMAQYARKDIDLAFRFLDAVDKKIKDIELFPQSFPIKIKKQYRRAVLSNFPYSIYYKTESANDIVIFAILSNNLSMKTILEKL